MPTALSLSVHPLRSFSPVIMLRILSDRKHMFDDRVAMNIRVLVDSMGPLFDQPFLPAAIQVTPNKIVFSSSAEIVESERVKPVFEILDVPLQIGVVNIGRST